MDSPIILFCFICRLNPKTDNLEMSFATFDKKKIKPGVINFLRLLNRFKLLHLEEGDEIVINNMTLINLILLWKGPLHEAKLTTRLMIIQV